MALHPEDQDWLTRFEQDPNIDRLFDYIDNLILLESFGRIDAMLEVVPVERFSPALLVGWLTITGQGWLKFQNQFFGIADHPAGMPHRADFVKRVEAHLKATLNDDARVMRLLEGLR